MTKRNIYLSVIPPAEAVQRTKAAMDRATQVQVELVPSHNAAGRVLAEAVFARHSSPTFHAAAMDGYAVLAKNTFGAREGAPLRLVEGQTCFAVNTGNALPDNTDAVIMIEHVVREGQDILLEAPAFPWQHVRRIGEDIVATELLFARNRQLSPSDVGALLSGGVWDVPVWERLRVHIIPTGDEVLDFTSRPNPCKGQVVESNSQMLAALAREIGCTVTSVPPVPDRPDALHEALKAGLEAGAHLTILCAGSSAGSKDFSKAVMEREGEVLVHGISVMPGKPSLLAVCGGRLVAGAPGYPVSTLVCFEELLKPLLCWLSHRELPRRPVIDVELTRAVPSRIGVEEHVRLAVGCVDAKYVGVPLSRGAGNLTSVTRAQAMTRIPAACEGLPEATIVPAELCVSPESLERIVVCVGSHDNTLDLLADELMALPDPVGFVSTHVGSMGGLTALANGSCHLSGMHLFDPETRTFNFPFLRKFLIQMDLRVINLAIRHQGLIVAKGNPLGICGIQDLTRVRFLNRQRGAGTRILLDHKLHEAGIQPAAVNGYQREEITHMAVAVNVLSGSADCGMGIAAAAQALDLDFVPIADERYDLVIPTRFMEHPGILAIRKLLRTDAFKERIVQRGGYETALTGCEMQEE